MLNVIVNAFPKSGTHALQKACLVLGVNAELVHLPYPQSAENASHHLFIARDPRNIIASQIRASGLPVTQGTFLAHFRRGFIQDISLYTPWLTDSGTHVVRYEDLIASDEALRGIAEFLGTPYLDDAFENLPGHTRTWRIPHVDYTQIWTPNVAQEWNAEGGAELLEMWGYCV